MSELETLVIDAAMKLISLAMDLVGHDRVKDMLSAEAIRRQNALADIAEKEKFG